MIIPVVLHVSIKSIPELAMMSATYLSVSVSLCFFFGEGGRVGAESGNGLLRCPKSIIKKLNWYINIRF